MKNSGENENLMNFMIVFRDRVQKIMLKSSGKKKHVLRKEVCRE